MRTTESDDRNRGDLGGRTAVTSAAQVLQVRASRAQIGLVAGTRDEVGAEAVRQSRSIP